MGFYLINYAKKKSKCQVSGVGVGQAEGRVKLVSLTPVKYSRALIIM